jgi:uncharacterized protein (TIGR00369 family)
MIWQEPAPGGYPDRAVAGLSGQERQKAGREGRMPNSPMSYLTELHMTEASVGHSAFEIPASPWFANSTGLIGGGVLAVIADACLGSVVHGDLPPGQFMTTAELSLSFLRPVAPRPGRSITGAGQLIHRGRTMGLSEAFLFDPGDELIAHGTSRCTVFPPLDPSPERPGDGDLPVIDQPIPGASPDDPLQREPEGEVIPQEEFERRGGREVLQAFIDGELPPSPLHHLTGLRLTEVGDGEAAMVLPCSRWLSTSAGTIQGGFTAMAAEAAMAAAVFSTAPAGTAIAPLDLKVNYLRPVFPDDHDLVARARVQHQGRTITVANAELTNAEGKSVALATGSSMYLPGRPADLSGVEQLGSESSDPEDEPGA